MKHIMVALFLGVFSISAFPTPAEAGPLNRACLKSDRSAANRRLCRCMQKVANRELRHRDQRIVASFFKDPHKAQELRQSDRRAHEQFWTRYKTFSSTFASACSDLN